MFKYFVFLMLICVTGCQTTQTAAVVVEPVAIERSERLLLRAEKMVGTYEVRVQRVALVGEDADVIANWEVDGSVAVSGYPGTFRRSEGAVEDAARVGSYLLAGDWVKVSHEPGVHLVVKVLPELQNTARILGVYVHVTSVGEHFETFSYPFDVHCNLGDVMLLYSKELPLRGMDVSVGLAD